MRTTRFKALTALGGTILIAFISAMIFSLLPAQAQNDDGRTTLTVEETLGAVFLRPQDPEDWMRTLRASANPEAKPELYKLLNNQDIRIYHPNILRMLGYVGNTQDVEKLNEWLGKILEGGVDQDEYRSITRLFDALARMSRRGIEPARSLLSRLVTPQYWKENVDLSRVEGAPALLKDYPVAAFLPSSLPAYLKSGAGDWKQKISAMKDYIGKCGEEEVKRYLEPLGDVTVMRKEKKQYAKNISERHYPPIPKKVREYLPKMFNGDIENPARADIDTTEK